MQIGQYVKYVAATLDVSEREADEFPIANVRWGESVPTFVNAEVELLACAFLLMVGLWRPQPAAARFFAAGFSTVYRMAALDKLPWDLWRRLEPLLPWHFRYWDNANGFLTGRCGGSWSARGMAVSFCEHSLQMSLLIAPCRC